MPVLQPAELWRASGRYDIDELFKLQDRRGADLVLAMTHEEALTFHMAREVRSYRDLPKLLYHFQTKERDEPRPRAGVLRTREFIMKDAYSFDRDREGLDRSYDLYAGAYDRVFDRAGLEWYRVESDVGMMGGFGAHEYMAPCAGRRERCGAVGRRLRRQRRGRECDARAARGPARAAGRPGGGRHPGRHQHRGGLAAAERARHRADQGDADGGGGSRPGAGGPARRPPAEPDQARQLAGRRGAPGPRGGGTRPVRHRGGLHRAGRRAGRGGGRRGPARPARPGDRRQPSPTCTSEA